MKFTLEEKHFLNSYIAEKINIIENKNTDAVGLQAKKNSWVEIHEAFNAVPEHEKRLLKQIQKYWDNEKTKRKKKLSQEKRSRMETGGGPCIPPPDSDENDPVIDAILTNVTDIEVPCIDSDAIMTGEYVLSPKSGRLVEKDFSPDSSFEGIPI
ncbi:hypothetical protein M8J76_014107 [Diaphorina citri]|nr:hypothetical protein M8J75_015690 [Diaphorina citri]KAI5722812.1 hypothetical protein M8J76_014107 [Diaphorina citri]